MESLEIQDEISDYVLKIALLSIYDIKKIITFQNAMVPAEHHWNREQAIEVLTETPQAKGEHVRIVWRGFEIVGLIGYIIDNKRMYGWPFLVADEESAKVSLEHIISISKDHGISELRISSPHENKMICDVLSAHRFQEVLDFIELELDIILTKNLDSLKQASNNCRVNQIHIDYQKFTDLHNTCFHGQENAPDISVEHAIEIWSSKTLWKEGSQIWSSESGQYKCFALISCKDDVGTIDAIGVHPEQRKQGMAQAMLLSAVQMASDYGIKRLRAIIANSNVASLQLHQNLGFSEIKRRTVWQLVTFTF